MQNSWLQQPLKAIDDGCYAESLAHQAQLTKPAGSLGQLESIACRLAAMQQRRDPDASRVRICLFAADHGIARAGVSAFPQEVTVQMVANFSQGGAAISVLARSLGAELEVVDMGTCSSPLSIERVVDRAIGPGTRSFEQEPAMNRQQLEQALAAGAERVEEAFDRGCDLFIAGEMGIGNTSSATAIAAALLDRAPSELVGPGTGIDREHVTRKAELIAAALQLHREGGVDLSEPLAVLECVGGFEIAAMTGAYLRCAQLGIPMLVDGFISSAAFLCAERLAPGCREWAFVGHCSAEPGHRILLESMVMDPLLQLQMRLGEGSGAAVAVPLLRSACALHNQMATFAQAGVSAGD
ncbi:nicotinate-nucleotide--dimethylbenzimidazole phosphoribosyltransferase [Aestuariirhabdus litorea]|uniref:Nicotinate-nucleotide--dimethylbenzimidazole phosphoribosyltransferase n=1 Tax=Aestuariirhabdus litorea TaxID=2528527 RepID=A0A3P3VSG7_9GAMM|nr:nicotinate-nucleotide--dimethylbenzimidazole phosphoribosyltransferase [Aestuariirhabdus litorea]RRJ84636.1 nicotinate-nucleotide--dimethylbenzimidazole phosphoribosyltransferase [Aestuariirhabdus litorea]RWW97861.1 nicotinate-nucleotide--dimethylbenzimidazole phosphoribosyltransferase [Endozoicomonadaceae bacterium GTF-13]